MVRPPGLVKPLSCLTMRELRRSNDLVYLSLAEAVLRQAGLRPVILDSAMSAADGSIGALPRRLVAPDADAARALELLAALDAAHDGRS
ncbi:MAG: DUF2007 domain-containing protein [Hyphomonadaceae bacterium]